MVLPRSGPLVINPVAQCILLLSGFCPRFGCSFVISSNLHTLRFVVGSGGFPGGASVGSMVPGVLVSLLVGYLVGTPSALQFLSMAQRAVRL